MRPEGVALRMLRRETWSVGQTLASAMAVLAGLTVAPAAAQPCDSAPLLIRNTGVWTRDGTVSNQDVLFRDGRIATIERAGARQHDGVRRIDGTGHTLLPGLIDSHLHFSVPGGLPASDPPRDADQITGRQLLRSGVTAGRLHLSTLEEAVRLKARSSYPCEPLPRLQVGGPGLSGAAERDFGNFQGAKSRDDAIAKVERFGAAGVDWLAIHDADKFPVDILEAAAQAARRLGLRLMASGGTAQEITAALSINPDTLDYFDRTTEPAYAGPILDALRARRNLILVPTPGVPYRTGEYLRNPSSLERAENFEFLAPADRTHVLANAVKDLAGSPATQARRVLQSLPTKFRQLRQLGLPMALGSDAGSQLHFQSGAIWWELEAWRTYGASRREALIAATATGARVLRESDSGRLAAGHRADFVLYRGNVEEGPFEMARVIAVGKGGVLMVADGRWVGPAATIVK